MSRLLLLLCVVASMFFISYSRPAEKRSEPHYLLDAMNENDMKEINPDEAEKRMEEPELMDDADKGDQETDLAKTPQQDAHTVVTLACYKRCRIRKGRLHCVIVCLP